MTDVALLVLRVVLGGTYIAHGLRKLGWRHDGDFAGFRGSIERRGYRPAWFWAGSAVAAEIVGGVLAILGLLTPIAGALLLAQSVTIVALVRGRGFWVEAMGVEYPLMLGTASMVIALAGPGAVSLDAVLGLDVATPVRVTILIVAVAGAVAGLLTRAESPDAAAAARANRGPIPPGR